MTELKRKTREKSCGVIMIDVLRPFPAHNMNRDESGRPKSMIIGGVQRSYISAQALKRAIKDSDAWRYLDPDMPEKRSARSRFFPNLIYEMLIKDGMPQESAAFAAACIPSLTKTEKAAEKKKGKDQSEGKTNDPEKDPMAVRVEKIVKGERITDNVMTMSDTETRAYCTAIRDIYDTDSGGDPEKFKTVISIAVLTARYKKVMKSEEKVPWDTAMFGKMATEGAQDTVDGAVKMTPAVSVNPAYIEQDLFSTNDDLILRGVLKGDDEDSDGPSGSAHLGSRDFTSGVYHYTAEIDLDTLAEYAGNSETMRLYQKIPGMFFRILCSAVPSGNRSNFLVNSLACTAYARYGHSKSMPTMAEAFHEPVRGGKTKEKAAMRMFERAGCDNGSMSIVKPEKSAYYCEFEEIEGPEKAEKCMTLDGLAEVIDSWAEEYMTADKTDSSENALTGDSLEQLKSFMAAGEETEEKAA